MTRRVDKPDTPADIELRKCLESKPPQSFIMVAGAGSGKTTSLVKALDFLEKEIGDVLRCNSQRIACITYTEIAVGEIWGDVGHDPIFHVSTIHSFLWSVVRSFQQDIAEWVVARIEGKIAGLREEEANFGPRVQQKTRDRVAREIADLSAQLLTIGEVKSFTYGTGSDYSNGILGHDDIIKLATTLIVENDILGLIVSQKYPIVFVDESQDTLPDVVEALTSIQKRHADRFCLGYFGDPMQKIYATGAGAIAAGEGWATITKPENFRCPAKVLEVINKIRRAGDGLQQTGGRQQEVDGKLVSVPGTAKAFVIANERKTADDLDAVRKRLSVDHDDPLWLNDDPDAGVKILVVVHRMAATRLGFGELYGAFNDQAPENFKSSFLEGTAWPTKPFLDFVLPLADAKLAGNEFAVVQLLKKYSDELHEAKFPLAAKPTEVLAHLDAAVENLVSLVEPTSASTVKDALEFLRAERLYPLDDRLIAPLAAADPEPGEERTKEETSMAAFLRCPASQFWGYWRYLQDESPYSTQQGIKGAEFDRVIVVLDDVEGTHIHFSYDKLLGLKDPSATDTKNIAEGKDSVFDRTRRLYYVCCSRSLQDLAVVYYSDDPGKAVEKLAAGGFDKDDIRLFAAKDDA